MSLLLELQSVRRSYQSGEESLDVLKNISLKIYSGELVAIIGASGSGKSTLMNILGCLDQASSGTYYIAGQNVVDLNNDDLAILRREYFGFIFQRYHLLPHLSAAHNVEIPSIYAGSPKNERQKRAVTLLTRLGLAERINYRPNQLSGGQQQRVSIARALMNGGQIILADEPTGALDSHSSVEVMNILKQLQQKGHTVIVVTHNPEVANQADRTIEIKDGEIISDSGYQPTQELKKIPEPSSPSVEQASCQQWVGRLHEALLMAWRAMLSNKMRTALTMLGIIIGIASVVSILVVGDAAQQKVLANIRAIGTNTISIYPGRDYGDDDPSNRQALIYEDIAALQAQSYISAISPIISGNIRLRLGNIDVASTILGVGGQYFKAYGIKIQNGERILERQVRDQSQVVVIDKNTQRRLFPRTKDVIGKEILVGNIPMTVVGIAKEKQSMYGNNNALRIWIPYSTMTNLFTGRSYFDAITVRIKEGYNNNEAEQQLIRLLTLRHGKKDIYTFNVNTVLKTAEKTTRTMQLFLSLVAAISLVVGGIGVMNIMLVSVTERTREIGIRMAVGARSSDVLQQFLIEAVLVCLVGGTIGILLSFCIGFAVEFFLPTWSLTFSSIALFIAFFCSTMIGIVFGYLPARHASRLNPIDALAPE